MRVQRDAPSDPGLARMAREWKTQPENQFDMLPLDQQIVRLNETVAYLTRRCEQAETACLIADTTATNLHNVIQRQRDGVRGLQRYSVGAVEHHGGDGQTFYAVTEVEAHNEGALVRWDDLCRVLEVSGDDGLSTTVGCQP